MGEAKRKAATKDRDNSDQKFWIAINGASCAMASFPMKNPKVTPTPTYLIGFPTIEEARHAQHVCLTAPLAEARRFVDGLVAQGEAEGSAVGVQDHARRIVVITPANPEPPTRGETMWVDE
jgi:hypothetical protein